jgi:hypothetical protein
MDKLVCGYILDRSGTSFGSEDRTTHRFRISDDAHTSTYSRMRKKLVVSGT